MTKYYISLLVFFLGTALLAQQTEREKDIYQMFDNPSKVQWIKHYKGRIDDLNDISVSLAYDGSKCKGRMQYLRSKAEFLLDGTMDGTEVKLLEIDDNQEVSGFLRGDMRSGEVNARWMNFDGSIEGRVRLEQTKKEAKFPSHCGDNKWIRYYQGKYFKQKVEVIVQKDNADMTHGLIYFEKEEKSFELQFKQKEDDLLVFDIKDEFGKNKGTIKGAFQIDDHVAAYYVSENGEKGYAHFTIRNVLPVGCIEYADYMTSYDITYPRTKHANFNKWMKGLTDDWVSSCKDYARKVRGINKSKKPPLRAAVRAFAWCDVELYSDQLISGYINFTNTWSERQRGKTFAYDLGTGKEITLMNIFNDDFDYKKFIRTYINNEISKHPLYRDYDYRKWVANQDFSFFTIRKEGLSFATQYSMIYGQQQVTIPFWKLKPYLRKNSPVVHLIR